MASNSQTSQFKLCQWSENDPVLRTDFNADNSKLESALSKHAAAIAKLQPTYGTYMGTGISQTQIITLGFQPSFVLILTNGGRVNTGNPMGAQMLLSGVNGYSSAMLSNGFSVTGATNYVAVDEGGYGVHRLPYRYVAFR